MDDFIFRPWNLQRRGEAFIYARRSGGETMNHDRINGNRNNIIRVSGISHIDRAFHDFDFIALSNKYPRIETI